MTKRDSRGSRSLRGSRLFGTPTADHVEPLSLDAFAPALGGAHQAIFLFGYYDRETLGRLLDFCGNKTEVIVVLNGLAGPALDQQVRDLRTLERRRKKGSTEVCLFFSRGIFHPKLIVALKRGTHGRAWLGSANATSAAFPVKGRSNEEIMVELEGDLVGLVSFAVSILDDERSVRLSDIGTTAITLRSTVEFFRNGVLAFRPTNTLSLSFNPYREAISSLSQEQRAALGAQRIRNSTSKPGIGPFSIARAVGVNDLDDDQSATKVSPLKFGFETLMGYWIPLARLADFEKQLSAASRDRVSKLRDLALLVSKLGQDGISNAFRTYVGDTRRRFRDVGAPDPGDGEGGEAFLRRIWDVVRRDDFTERYGRTFLITAMPEIWEDQRVSRRFEESVFEGLVPAVHKGGRHSKGHVKRLLDIIESSLDPSEDAEDPRDMARAFRRHLKEHGLPRDWLAAFER